MAIRWYVFRIFGLQFSDKMKKVHILIASIILAFSAGRGVSQTTAMDFTRADCDGAEHHLYQELNEGKVVVLEYIMLGCPSCILASQKITELIGPFEATNPGRVKQYMFGFIKNYTCAQLKSWQSENTLSGTVFEDGSSQVGYYGGMGMPTIVVTANNTHQVLYVKVGYQESDTTAIKAAIATGLQYNPQGIGDDLSGQGVRIYPTLFTDRFNVSLPAAASGKLMIFDMLGREVAAQDFDATSAFTVGGLNLHGGIYFVVLKTSEGILGSMKMIRQ
jgi:hypothetical protein